MSENEMANPVDARDAGEAGEAVTASLISDVLGGDLVYQHTPGEAPQGIDVGYLNDGQLHVAEVKSVIGDWHQPATASTVSGRQMDAEWVADRLGRVDIEADPPQIGDLPGQVGTELFQVDYPGDTVARYELDSSGARVENSPQEIWSLSDVLGVHEASQDPEGEVEDENYVEHGASETDAGM